VKKGLQPRPDDNVEVFSKRLDTYWKQTAPVLPYYKERKLLTPIDGTKPIEQVAKDIKSIIVANSFLSSSQFHKIVILENCQQANFIQKTSYLKKFRRIFLAVRFCKAKTQYMSARFRHSPE